MIFARYVPYEGDDRHKAWYNDCPELLGRWKACTSDEALDAAPEHRVIAEDVDEALRMIREKWPLNPDGFSEVMVLHGNAYMLKRAMAVQETTVPQILARVGLRYTDLRALYPAMLHRCESDKEKPLFGLALQRRDHLACRDARAMSAADLEHFGIVQNLNTGQFKRVIPEQMKKVQRRRAGYELKSNMRDWKRYVRGWSCNFCLELSRESVIDTALRGLAAEHNFRIQNTRWATDVLVAVAADGVLKRACQDVRKERHALLVRFLQNRLRDIPDKHQLRVAMATGVMDSFHKTIPARILRDCRRWGLPTKPILESPGWKLYRKFAKEAQRIRDAATAKAAEAKEVAT